MDVHCAVCTRLATAGRYVENGTRVVCFDCWPASTPADRFVIVKNYRCVLAALDATPGDPGGDDDEKSWLQWLELVVDRLGGDWPDEQTWLVFSAVVTACVTSRLPTLAEYTPAALARLRSYLASKIEREQKLAEEDDTMQCLLYENMASAFDARGVNIRI